MDNWRDHILKEFTPRVARLTLAADPDGLLLEEGILEQIRAREFELIQFEDHIAFRYLYESRFRCHWDRGEHTDLVVLLHSDASKLSALPHDLLRAGRKISFNLASFFPTLSYPVVSALDRADLDPLYEAQKQYAPGLLGDNATKEFVLRHVFGIAPELVKQDSDLLRVLLRRHYRGERIPRVLDERFIKLVRQSAAFQDWPVEILVTDRDAFFAFLQERWPIFLDHEATKSASVVRGSPPGYGLTVDGPTDLPFDHPDVRVYLNDLFAEGFLRSVRHPNASTLSKTWTGIGIRTDPLEDRSRRVGTLIETLQANIPVDDARHTDWFHFAHAWAELVLLLNEPPDRISWKNDHAVALRAQADTRFTAWLVKRYAGLVNLPPVPPVMLHHIPRFLARQLGEDGNTKIALIVVDGLSLDQWLVVRTELARQRSGLRFREEAVFAWIPSLTAVSRQAIFAGKPPMFFPNSIFSTDREPALWMQFWADQGLRQSEVVYIKRLGDGSVDNVSEALSNSKTRVAALVIEKVDKILHGMEMGTAGMHNQVAEWARQAYLTTLLDVLFDRGFSVYLTSDHGNVEADGCGRPAEGMVADIRGQRARIYPNVTLRRSVKERFPTALEWGPVGLPEDYLVLLAPSRQAFVDERRHTVSHGGISVEEMIVPLIQIERRGE